MQDCMGAHVLGMERADNKRGSSRGHVSLLEIGLSGGRAKLADRLCSSVDEESDKGIGIGGDGSSECS